MINITESTIVKLQELIQEENNPNLKFRIYVQGGGCSGMSYGFALEETQNEDDFVIENDKLVILVDAMSMQYLNDSTIDYAESIMGAGFNVENPNAETSCGCGSSFSVKDEFYDDYSFGEE